jgi:hypothetical protein
VGINQHKGGRGYWDYGERWVEVGLGIRIRLSGLKLVIV